MEDRMADVSEVYIDGIRKKMDRYYATWMPGTPYNLGDVGLLEKNKFTYVDNLRNLGIEFKIRKDLSPSSIYLHSKSEVNFKIDPSAEIHIDIPNAPEFEAGIEIEFGAKGAFLFESKETYNDLIDDQIALGAKIKKAFNEGTWREDYVVIVELIRTPFASIFISKKPNTKIGLSLKSNIPIKTVDLGDARIDLSVTSQSESVIHFPGAKDITPFLRLSKLIKKDKSTSEFAPLKKKQIMSVPGGRTMSDTRGFKLPDSEYEPLAVFDGGIDFEIIEPEPLMDEG
jgi:hypothetical protein